MTEKEKESKKYEHKPRPLAGGLAGAILGGIVLGPFGILLGGATGAYIGDVGAAKGISTIANKSYEVVSTIGKKTYEVGAKIGSEVKTSIKNGYKEVSPMIKQEFDRYVDGLVKAKLAEEAKKKKEADASPKPTSPNPSDYLAYNLGEILSNDFIRRNIGVSILENKVYNNSNDIYTIKINPNDDLAYVPGITLQSQTSKTKTRVRRAPRKKEIIPEPIRGPSSLHNLEYFSFND